MKKINNYWADRQKAAQDKLTDKKIEEVDKQLVKYYGQTMKAVITDFEATYNKILVTVAAGGSPTPADLYKLDRYWEMQGRLRDELQKLGDKQIYLLSHKFEEEFFDVYDSIAIKGAKSFSTISTEAARQMINSIWVADGKTWSQRIWKNIEQLTELLNEELISCVVSGRKTSYLKEALQEKFLVSYGKADSIVRTEMAHIQTQAARQRYEDYGIREVMVWADKDERRCDVCGKLHTKKYPVGAAIPIPAHPNCRCCIIPVVED